MTATAFAFGPFRLDPQRKHLFRDGEPVAIPARHVDLLSALVSQAGRILTKDQLVDAAWGDVSVTDNSIEKAIGSLRRLIGPEVIETQPRRGYRFVGEVRRVGLRETDAAIEALLAPHRAWIEGRAALETLEGPQIQHAREVFEHVLAVAPDQAAAHVGLANACAFQFEMTRTDAAPDREALVRADAHAREACRLDPGYGEAWATLGFILERTGQPVDARAALRRAVSLEPDNWRHHLRLAYGSWGEERLRASRRTLALLPGFPMAHWLAATVHVARQVFGEAQRELTTGLSTQAAEPPADARFGAVALHWLSGLIHLSQDEDDAALEAFERELAQETRGLLYARECSANVEYAIGALHLRRGRGQPAAAAFERALTRVPGHGLARVGLAHALTRGGARTSGAGAASAWNGPAASAPTVDEAVCRAAALTLEGAIQPAAALVQAALDAAPPGQAGWMVPLDPLLYVQAHPTVWASVLARLRARAA